jgi:hypothetical protein
VQAQFRCCSAAAMTAAAWATLDALRKEKRDVRVILVGVHSVLAAVRCVRRPLDCMMVSGENLWCSCRNSGGVRPDR